MSDHSPFVGRKSELAELDAALSLAQGGVGSFVLVAGEPGIGKTTLCTSFTDRARRNGARVLWGRAWEWGGAPPFWPWVQVVRGLDTAELRSRSGVLEAFAGASESEASLAPKSAGNRFALFDAVTESLRERALAGPIVIVLEDLHASDASTMLLLRFAIEQLRDAAVLVLGTWRTVESSPTAEVSTLMADMSRMARTIDLGGLAPGDIAEFIARVGSGGDSERAAVLHDRTGGNPLLVASLLHPSGPSEPSGVPLRARAAVERRVARLESTVRSVLSAASVIGREMAVLLLAKVCERRLDEVLEPVRTLVAERILVERHDSPGRYGFCHGLFREVVYEALSPAERLKLHRAAGLALEELYGTEREAHLAELARHFLAVAPDPERGGAYAAGAGEQAMRSLAYEDAIAHFMRAIAAFEPAADPTRVGNLLSKLASAQAAAGATAEARENYRRAHRIALDTADPVLEAEVTIAFARGAGFGRADDESVRWLERALERAPTKTTRVRLLSALIERLWPYPAAQPRVESLSDEVLELARECGDPRVHALALASTLVVTWNPGSRLFTQHRARAEELLRIAEQLADPELLVEASRWRFTTSMMGGDIDDAKRALDAYERVGEQLARPQLRFNALLRRMMLASMEGRFDDALELVGAFDRAARRAGDPQAEFLKLGALVQLSRAMGDLAAIETYARQFEGVVGNDLPPVVRFAIVAAIEAQLGHLNGARRALEKYFEVADGFLVMGGPIALACATWAVWLLGDSQRAKALMSSLVPFEDIVLMGGAIEFHGPGSLYLGLAAATAGDHERAAAYLEKATTALDRMGARYYATQARSALTEVRARIAEAPGASAAPQASSPETPEGIFAAEGEYHTVGFAGRVARVRSSKGLVFIEALLRREGTEVHVLELAGSALDDRGSEPPLLDARAKAEYRARVESLRAEIDEADAFGDLGRAARAREELEALMSELSRATGLGGRDRATGTAERARARVTLAIRRAVKGLEGVSPELAAHFGTAITTGTFCTYRPEPRARISWRFEPPVDS